MNTKNSINVAEIARIAIEIATVKGSIVRNKAFAAGFERIETNWGKGALDTETKASLRREIDSQIKEKFMLTKHEVIIRGANYEQVNAHGEYETGRKITSLDNAPKTDAEIILGMVRVLDVHRLKVSKKEDGASEGDIRKERRIRNAILGLLDDMSKTDAKQSAEFSNTKKYMDSLPSLRTEEMPTVSATEPAAA